MSNTGNTQVIEKGQRKAREIIDNRIMASLVATAFDLETLRPFGIYWTGNLLDSIGCAIYQDGRLERLFTPDQKASDPRSGAAEYPAESRVVEGSEIPIGGGNDAAYDIFRAWWGSDELVQKLLQPPPEISNMTDGFALYYVAAMPYAEIIDAKYRGIVLEEEQVGIIFKTQMKRYASN